MAEDRLADGTCARTGYGMATKLYLPDQHAAKLLPPECIERVVLAKAMQAYDGASNGNRNRGGMKKANDM